METMQHQQVPTWLNLDAIITPELRERIKAEIPEIELLAKEVADITARLSTLRDDIDAHQYAQDIHGPGCVDGLAQYADALSGWVCIEDALVIIAGASTNLNGGTPSESNYRTSSELAGVPVVRDHTYLVTRVDSQD